jgi:hypothetical protein
MRALRFSLFLISLVASCSVFAQQRDWLPITQQDWQVKDDPSNPGAAAIQLYYSFYQNDNDLFVSIYRRIKILRQAALGAGSKYVAPEIEILRRDASVKEFAARTIHPDGTIIDFKDKLFEKTLYKRRGIKIQARTFTFPDVTVGSIVEYRIKITWLARRVLLASLIPIETDLYTVKADYQFQPTEHPVRLNAEWSLTGSHYSQAKCTYLHGIGTAVPHKNKTDAMELSLDSIPVFQGEDYMPPELDYTPVLVCYYGGHEVDSPDKFWSETGKNWDQWVEKFIGNFQQIREAANKAIGSASDPEQKLRKLYERAQQVRNLSYERSRTQQELHKEDLKPNASVLDVLNHGYGDSEDIAIFFVALARAAGFEAHVIQASDRQELSFQEHLMFTGQVPATEALVKINDKEVVLDPGTPFCPFGLVPWQHSSTTALKLSTQGSELITTPPTITSNTHRVAKLELSPDASLRGEITVELEGEDALQHRLEALKTDEAGRRKDFEEEIKTWLPPEAVVKMTDSNGWDSADQPLTARFSIEIANFASAAGKRLVVPAFLFPTFAKDMFKPDSRTYPIVFPYPFTENDEIDLKFPEGYSVERPPYRRKAGLSYAGYEMSSSEQNHHLIIKRQLRFDGASFPPEKFPELKNFFNVVHGGDAGEAIFKPAEAATAAN